MNQRKSLALFLVIVSSDDLWLRPFEVLGYASKFKCVSLNPDVSNGYSIFENKGAFLNGSLSVGVGHWSTCLFWFPNLQAQLNRGSAARPAFNMAGAAYFNQPALHIP